MDNSILQLDRISKSYSNKKHPAVCDVSLSLKKGTLLALVGQSGSGKTTLLRIIAGLEQPEQGVVWLSGAQVVSGKKSVPPNERGVGLVFQDYALFPHLNVRDNITFGVRGLTNQAQASLVREMLTLVNLPIDPNRFPHELSGGQQQRVALARALAPRPAVLLLDEPFSNLDAILREQVRDEIKQIVKQTGTSTILVTHDVRDALSTADQIAVMYQGKLLQMGEPQTIYNAPADEYVARLFGQFNILKVQNRAGAMQTPFGIIRSADHAVPERDGPDAICFRPEQAVLTGDSDQALSGIVQGCSFAGNKWTIRLIPTESEAPAIHLDCAIDKPVPEVGERVNFRPLHYRHWKSTNESTTGSFPESTSESTSESVCE